MGRALGLDPGTRRIGVAISDPTRTIASPLRYLDAEDGSHVDEIGRIVDEMEVSVIVIGLPIALDGSEGPSARMARELGTSLAALEIEVVFQDERFTSATAEAALISGGVRRGKRKERVDQVAASVMLQQWLEAERYRNNDD